MKRLKHVELKEESRVLLNQARAILLDSDPAIGRLTDDKVIRLALINYVKGVKYGK